MEKEPDKRFQSMEELATALANPQAFLEGRMPSGGFIFTPLFNDEFSKQHVVPTGAKPKPGFFTKNDEPPRAAAPSEKRSSTTLSGAASELAGRSSRRLPLLAAVGAAVVVLGGGALVLLRGGKPAVAPPAAVAPAATPGAAPAGPPAVENVTIKITSDPAGATVTRADQGGAVAGLTPLVLQVKKASTGFDVALSLTGYRPQTRTIVPDITKEIEVSLAPAEAARPAAAAVAVPAAAHPKKAPARKKDSLEDEDLRTLPPIF
jgi:hypothetical protein